MATFDTSLKSRIIYIFGINDEWHEGCLKIGETTLDVDLDYLPQPNEQVLNDCARRRIDQYTSTAGIGYQLLHTEMTAYFAHGTIKSFNDKQVHEVLVRSGIKHKYFDQAKKANEWFQCDLATAKHAISAVKQGKMSLTSDQITTGLTPIIFRPEQQAAISQTVKQFKRGNQMLWNAKMRFGKTLSALQVVKLQQYRRTLILTHRPVVDEGWFEDFNKIFYDQPRYHYGSRTKGETFQSLQQLAADGDSYVYFVSMQDMRGSSEVGGKFLKDQDVFGTHWDLLIIDEAHEGTTTELGASVISKLTKQGTKVLRLSGTPFNLIDDFKEDEIFTWDYVMEQRAKSEWDELHMGDPNPYASLPTLNLYTYDLGALMSEYADGDRAFNFHEFFRTDDDGNFVHDQHVSDFLDLMCKDDDESLYPFSCERFRRIFRHTLWVVPGVRSARALSKKLKAHPVLGNFTVVNVAGNGDLDEENADALLMVNQAIGPDPGQTWTITLSCGKLTTGVSVKPWTAVFMLAGSFRTSAASYLQTMFRVQTPFTYHGQMKTECYAFDFAPDRTLQVMAEAAHISAKAGKQTDQDRVVMGQLLNYCPIISISGSEMRTYDVDQMFARLKKVQIERVVQDGFENGALYNDELLKLDELDLKKFDRLKRIIGTTKAMPKTGDIDVNKQGLSNEEYEEQERLKKKPKKQLTDEEKERLEQLKAKQGQRRTAISILRGISIRMPLLLYGAEISDEDKQLTIDNFVNLVDDESWAEFMPAGVTKEIFLDFKKYYDPDVFREAGKRIREMARAADKFTIEERIERITAIFNTFRNPDKETVLTPPRVVNMHMADCLGGWCFFDEAYREFLPEPRWVEHEGVTASVFSPDSRILEINSKSGLYPLYCAYSVYRSRVAAVEAKYGSIGHAFSMSLWDTTIENNIFVVCKTPMAAKITRRTLAGFRDTKVNAKCYMNIIENIKTNPDLVVNTLRDGKHFWRINKDERMKFTAVVGNPPYQVMDGGNNASATPIYNRFVELAKSISPEYISMIMPAKWFNGGKGLDDFRTNMLSDKCLQQIFDFVDGHECFPTVDIAGGVCYILWNKSHTGDCEVTTHFNGKSSKTIRNLNSSDIFVRHKEELSILSKVEHDDTYLSVFPRKPFGIATNVKPLDEGDIQLRFNGGSARYNRCDVNVNQNLIDKWKVISSYLTAEHAGETDKNGQKRIISTLEILPPKSVCSETYLLLATFDDRVQAENFLGYMKTKFVRCMISMVTATQHLARTNFRYVPLQDFSKSWSDGELYAKYGLTQEEIDFIEATIKPME